MVAFKNSKDILEIASIKYQESKPLFTGEQNYFNPYLLQVSMYKLTQLDMKNVITISKQKYLELNWKWKYGIFLQDNKSD